MSKQHTTTHTEQANILLVDDTPANLNVLATILGNRGYRVRTAINGTMALKTIHKSPPDLILLDIQMPDMDGYEVCRRLKCNDQTRAIPVIFISALDDVTNKVDAFQVGGVDYVTKPFQVEEVVARVESQLTIRALQQQREDQVRELQALTTRLQTLTNRLQGELSLARHIQQGFLQPATPNWQPLQLVCYSNQAHEVGGDLYAYATLSNQHYAVAVGDVSGKGMPAALLMSACVASFRSLVEQALLPAAFLEQMDQALADYTQTTGQNCALVYLDIADYQRIGDDDTDGIDRWIVRISNAGCIPPIIKRADGTVEWVEIGGMPLGTGFGIQEGYREALVMLHTGDMVILTTDGVVEARNGYEDIFGFERLEQAIRLGPDTNPGAMLEHLLAAIEQNIGTLDLQDDMTMVVMQG